MFKKIACIDSRPLEIILALQAFLFGMFLLSPGQAFDSVQVYHVLALIAPEGIWGMIFVSLAMLETITVFGKSNRLRGTATTLALFLWLVVDLGSWLSNPNSAATVTYLVFVVIAAWSTIAVSARDYFDCEH